MHKFPILTIMQNFIKISALLTFVFFWGCKNGSSPTSGNFVNGNMVGYVYANDTTSIIGYTDSLPNIGIRISIDGTNYSAISDKEGRWEMDNVPPGTYNISFTKYGYAMEKWVAYSFAGNGTAYLGITDIYQIAKWNASFVLRHFEDYSYLYYKDTIILDSLGQKQTIQVLDTIFYPNELAMFSCRIYGSDPSASLTGPVLILFGKSGILSPLDVKSYVYSTDNLFGGSNYTIPDENGYTFGIRRSDLISSGFHSGDKVYCQAFVSNIAQTIFQQTNNGYYWLIGPSYFDITSGKQIYTAFGDNHSEVKSFILP